MNTAIAVAGRSVPGISGYQRYWPTNIPAVKTVLQKNYDREPEDLRRRMENVFGMNAAMGI